MKSNHIELSIKQFNYNKFEDDLSIDNNNINSSIIKSDYEINHNLIESSINKSLIKI